MRRSSTSSQASAHVEEASASAEAPSAAAAGGPGHLPKSKFKPMVPELERLQQSSWAPIYRITGMFSEDNWQNAAGADMYMSILYQAHATHEPFLDQGKTPDRYYTRLQVRGLHCWLAHLRLRDEPIDRHRTLFYGLMEHIWEQAGLDLTRDLGFGYIEMSKHLKAAQLSWHGLCKTLDDALDKTDGEELREAMSQILLRSVYVDEEGEMLVDSETRAPHPEAKAGSLWLADYLLMQRAHLSSLPAEDVLMGRLTWADIRS